MKEYFKDKDRRRGLIGTLTFHLILSVVFLLFGLKYYEPKPEDGILINFGNSAMGLGEKVEESAVESQPTPTTSSAQTQESALTQDFIDAPSLPVEEDAPSDPIEKEETQDSPNRSEEKSQETQKVEEPKPSDLLNDLLKNTQNSKTGGEGNTSGNQDQGAEDGDPNSSNRQGSGGGGSGDGNYLLGNRKALAKPKPNYPCTEQGRVVVKIYVDRTGKVVRAVAGERIPGGAATTTTSSCLYEQARKAALQTTWESDGKAPAQQSGYIVYNFSRQ